MNKQELYNKLRRQVDNELIDAIDEYVDLYSDRSCLDGWFTADELRRIADAMDELKKRYKAIEQSA